MRQANKAEMELEAALLGGLNSGKPIVATPAYWERKRRQLIERHQASDRQASPFADATQLLPSESVDG